MPLPLARKCGRGMGTALYYLLGRYRRVAIKNLTLVYGAEKTRAEIVGMARAVFQNFGETAVEFVKLPQLNREQTEALAVVEGYEHLAAAMERKRGILMISGHFGNWEFMSRYITLQGYELNVVVRDARDPVATKLLADTREGYGVNVLYRGSSARTIYSLLKKNQMVGILPDQNAADVFVPFFGFPTGTVNGPAALHLMTKAPLLFVWCTRLPGRTFPYRRRTARDVRGDKRPRGPISPRLPRLSTPDWKRRFAKTPRNGSGCMTAGRRLRACSRTAKRTAGN